MNGNNLKSVCFLNKDQNWKLEVDALNSGEQESGTEGARCPVSQEAGEVGHSFLSM